MGRKRERGEKEERERERGGERGRELEKEEKRGGEREGEKEKEGRERRERGREGGKGEGEGEQEDMELDKIGRGSRLQVAIARDEETLLCKLETEVYTQRGITVTCVMIRMRAFCLRKVLFPVHVTKRVCVFVKTG